MNRLLTVEECAAQARCSPRTIKRQILAGKLPVTWSNGRKFVAKDDWDKYLEAGGSDRTETFQTDDFTARVEGAFSPSVRTALYNGPAVYFLFYDDEIVYIGHTAKLMERLPKHCKSKQFNGFSFLPCGREESLRIEQWAIRRYRPRLNLR